MDAQQNPESLDSSGPMETFPKTRLFPEYWDLDWLYASKESAPVDVMNNSTPPDSQGMPSWVEPFPEPRTFPGGWDLDGRVLPK